MNSTGGGSYVCLLIFKKFVCMATTGTGEILPHSSLSEVCQPRSRLSAEPFRLIHSFIIRPSAAQDEPPALSLSSCLDGAADRWAGRCVHWSKMTTSPPSLLPGDTDLPDLTGQKRPRLSRAKGRGGARAQELRLGSGCRNALWNYLFMGEGASRLSRVAEKGIFSWGNRKTAVDSE